jgi:glycosyltransferase involved in cell wall biosynthesis
MATVSVIMPAYNVAEYIRAAVDSVKAQTVADWELLIVDDGSTDTTYGVAQRLAATDARIKLLKKSNGGISTARNTALFASTGDFIAILDSDDKWEPTYLAEQLAIFALHPEVDIVTGNGWFLDGRLDGQVARPYPDRRPEPTLQTILADETSIFIMSVFRRRVYETIGGFDEGFRSNEDYDFWLRAAIAGFRFRRNDRPLCHYRRRDDSVSAVDTRMLTGILRVYDKIRPLLADRAVELKILEAQTARFERESLAAHARQALSEGDVATAAAHLSALYAQGGGPAIGVASFMARHTPWLLARAFQLRRTYYHGAL